MTTAWIFPGQGSQSLNMGKNLAENFQVAADVFAEVDEALGQKLSAIMWGEDEATLTLTANAQPAIMAVSYAVCEVLEKEFGITLTQQAQAIAGHSLGEYSALCASGALSLKDSAKLLRIRGEAMQSAVGVGEGAMAAILGGSLEDVEAIAKEAAQGNICDVANDNAEGQVVISGSKESIERAIDIAKAKGIKRAMLLPVSAPFHCALMQPAQERMAEALSEAHIAPPSVPLYANVKASPITAPEEIRNCLIEQVTGRVRWRESMLFMHQNSIMNMVEIGHGKVLAGLMKRIVKEVEVTSIGDKTSIENFVGSTALTLVK